MKQIKKYTISESKKINKRDMHGTALIGNYYVYFDGLKTRATSKYSLVPLKQSQMPQYIERLVF